MQTLFTWQTTPELTKSEILSFYDDSIDAAYELLGYHLYLLTKVAEHSVQDSERRKGKLLPSAFDKGFTDKLYNNSVIQSLVRDKELKEQWENDKVAEKVPDDFTKKLYKTYSLSDTYTDYVNAESSLEGDREIILSLFKDLIKQEYFNDTIEDYYYNWLDDESIIVGTIKKIIKQLPETGLNDKYGPTKETIVDFGRNLLEYIVDHNTGLEDMIEPLIENWDMDRVARIDMIFIKMSVAEMIIFPTIPTKVSINEYIDLTKLYSTEKSKEFVNGILDKCLQTLSGEKKIVKSGRGLIE